METDLKIAWVTSGGFAVEITSPETHGGKLFQPHKGTSF